MDKFSQYQWRLFGLSTLHIALVIIRILVSPENKITKPIIELNNAQYEMLNVPIYLLAVLYVKVLLYALTLYSYLCCCCFSSLQARYRFRKAIISLDTLLSVIALIGFPIVEFSNVESFSAPGLAIKLEIAFYFTVMLAMIVNIFAHNRYGRAILELSLYRPQPNTGHSTSGYNTFQNNLHYSSAPPPYRERQAPNRRLVRLQEAPRNIQVAGLEESRCILSDGEGGIIFVKSVQGAALSTFRARTVEETVVVWISAEAIRRNPYNPEMVVLTAVEINQLDLGENERNAIRRAGSRS